LEDWVASGGGLCEENRVLEESGRDVEEALKEVGDALGLDVAGHLLQEVRVSIEELDEEHGLILKEDLQELSEVAWKNWIQTNFWRARV